MPVLEGEIPPCPTMVLALWILTDGDSSSLYLPLEFTVPSIAAVSPTSPIHSNFPVAKS